MQTNQSKEGEVAFRFREYFCTFDGIAKPYKQELHDALYHNDYFVDYNSFILSHN